VRDVGQERTECDHELDAEIARQPRHEPGERPPAQVRLDPEEHDRVA
jgi:hypothetical protein